MATIAASHATRRPDDNFFMTMAIVMSLVIVAGFSLQFAMGRSSFGAPPLVHAHAIVFMGWMVLNLLQNVFVTRGAMALHRTLGWIGAGWIVLMVGLGCAVTVVTARAGHVPFFFRPLQFLVFDPMTLFGFAGLTTAAIVVRRRTEWHRRFHYCAMSLLLGPAFGRLLPLPLLLPWAWEATAVTTMLFPIIGMIADIRRTGKAHPAWARGLAVMIGVVIVTEAITYTPIGTAIYRAVTAGSPGADVAPLAFAPPPAGSIVTGR